MSILTIRTDKPLAEIGLYDGKKQFAYETWEAHRQLAVTLTTKISDLLTRLQHGWPDISGVVVYEGPGSFTGLRIGVSVANALAYGLGIPIIGSSGDDWCVNGLKQLIDGEDEGTVLPKYGSLPHTTLPRK